LGKSSDCERTTLIHLSACAWHWSAAFDLPEYSPFACQARAAAGQQTCFDERVTMAMATWLQYFEASHFSNGEWPTTLEANQAFTEGDGSEERDLYRMTKLIKALRLLRLFRLARLVKLARLIKIVQEKHQINPFVLQLVKLCFKMSFLR
jgi:hypothetical protein